MSVERVLICGGGIAGLTLAVALEHVGIEVEVLEKRAEYGREGAGIILAQNALRMFDRIGLGAAFRRAGHRLGAMDVRLADGTVLQSMVAPDSVTIHRDRLHRILRDAVSGPVHLGCEPRQIVEDADGVVLTTRLGEHRADVLVGADGIRSAVRAQVFGDVPARSSGQTCWRAVVEVPRERAVEYWSPGARVGLVPLSEGRTYTYLVRDLAPGEPDPWRNLAGFREAFGGFPKEVRDTLMRIEDLGDLRRGHLEQVVLDRWYRDRVVLIGDAAHAMTPNMGQGACQAIEDAVVLAGVLSEEADVPGAFDRYVALRRARVDGVQRQSWYIGAASHAQGALFRAVRNTVVRLTPGWVTRAALDDLMSVPGVHRNASSPIHGALLMLTGLAHTVVGFLVFSPIVWSMMRGGGFDSIGEQFDRGTAFWFLAFGVMLFVWGHLMHRMERQQALPRSVGWQLLGVWATGAWFMPASGFWLALPQGVYLLMRRNTRSIA